MGAGIGEVESRLDAIRDDAEHGATYLTREAVTVMRIACLALPADSGWAPGLTSIADRLGRAKPAMVGISNAARRYLGKLLERGPAEGKRDAAGLWKEILDEIDRSSANAVEAAAALLPEQAVVATCSYSSAVARVLESAGVSGRGVRVVVFESEPGPAAAGRRLAAELIGIGVQATMAFGLATEASLHGLHAALVGADAVTPGFVVNGTPSLALAEAVRGRAPLYVVAETLKFARRVALSPGYDRIPLDLVTAVVSEVGVQDSDELARWFDEAARGTA